MIAMLPSSSLGNEVTFHCLYLLDARRVRSLDVKSTEVNTEKGLKTRHFRELGVLFRLSDFFVLGIWQPNKTEG